MEEVTPAKARSLISRLPLPCEFRTHYGRVEVTVQKQSICEVLRQCDADEVICMIDLTPSAIILNLQFTEDL